MDLSIWTAETWVAVVAALISTCAFIATALQAHSAREQVSLAREQVAEARRQTELQEQVRRDNQVPYVWLDYRPNRSSESGVDLVLKNEGPTTATQIKVRMDPPIPRMVNGTQRQFMDLPGFIDGFSALPPGREMRWLIGAGKEIFAQEGDQSYRITVSYHGPDGPVDPVEYVLDLREAMYTAIYTPATMKHLVDAIKAQTKTIGDLKGLEVEG